MKVGYRKLGWVLGAVVAVALLPVRAEAQFVRYSPVFWSFEGSAGLALPMGGLGDTAESGPSFRLAASYFLNPRFALRAEGGIDLMGTAGTTTATDPDLQVWHFTGGFEYHLTDPTSNTMFAFDLGLGGASFDTGIFTANDFPTTGANQTGAFQNTYMAAKGGLKLGYNFARHGGSGTPIATIFVQGSLHLIFADEDETARYASLANNTSGFSTAMQVPITAGIRFNIP